MSTWFRAVGHWIADLRRLGPPATESPTVDVKVCQGGIDQRDTNQRVGVSSDHRHDRVVYRFVTIAPAPSEKCAYYRWGF